MADELDTGDLEAKTEIPESQEAETSQVDDEDGYIYDFRNLDNRTPAAPEEKSEAEGAESEKPKEAEASPGETVKAPSGRRRPTPSQLGKTSLQAWNSLMLRCKTKWHR